jgi:hypothetical protein
MAPKNQRSEEGEEFSDSSRSTPDSTPGDSIHKRIRINKNGSNGPSRTSGKHKSLRPQEE